MNRLSKIISTLVIVLLLFSLVGCGGSVPGDEPAPDNDSSLSGDGQGDEATEPESAGDSAAAFTETALASIDECTVTAKSFAEDSVWGPTFTLYLENNTADKTLMFSIEGASVNGFMCDPLWAEEVAAGKKTNSDVSWSTESLESNGINHMEEVEFTLRVYDSDDWSADDIFNETVTLTLGNTSGEPASEPVAYDHGFSEITLASTDTVTVVAKDYNEDGLLGPELVLYLENNSDMTLMYTVEEVSVNGFMCDPFWSSEVRPGKKEYSDVSWLSSTMEENGITAIESIEFTLKIYDSNDWGADDIFNEILTIDI